MFSAPILVLLDRQTTKGACTRSSIAEADLEWSNAPGSWLGPISFLVMIDDLAAGCITHKYVDDTALTEVLKSTDRSFMQNYFCNLIKWTHENGMQVNTKRLRNSFWIMGPT